MGAEELVGSINGRFEFANMIREIRMDKPKRLFHVNFLSKSTLKKGVLNVQYSYSLIEGKG